MPWILFAAVGAAFGELANTLGKKEVRDHVASYFTYGCLNLLFVILFLLIIGIVRHDFIFTTLSLPTFIPRLILEIFQAHVTVLAVVKADRSDYGPFRMLTVPILLVIDNVLGYSLLPMQLIGAAIICGAIFWLIYSEKFHTKGLLFMFLSTVNAAATISLYKYDITHFNSFESEQLIVCLVLLFYFFILAVALRRENPLTYLKNPAFFIQAVANGFGSSMTSFAYLFAPASIVTTAIRAFVVLFSILSGKLYFKEKRFLLKLGVFVSIVCGLLLLI